MNQFEQDIKQAQFKRVESILNSFVDGDELKKGFDNAGSLIWDGDFSIEATGKEIKEKLKDVVAKTSAVISQRSADIVSCRQEIGSEPDGEMCCGYRLYKYSNGDNKLESYHNSCIYTIDRLNSNLENVNFLLRTIPDNKKYKLNASRAKDLGF